MESGLCSAATEISFKGGRANLREFATVAGLVKWIAAVSVLQLQANC
jgi:hypothetical protein